MRIKVLVAAAALGSSTLFVAASASATNYTLWVHGRNTGGIPRGFSYWADHTGYNVTNCSAYNTVTSSSIGETDVCSSSAGYATPVAVDYDGSNYVSVTNPTVTAAMQTYCSGANSCYIVCHSAGCSQVGYTLATQPSTPGGSVGSGWHVNWMRTAGSVAGGSDVADAIAWLSGYNIDSNMGTGYMRSWYNHDAVGNATAGHIYNYLGGDWASLTNTLFPCNSSFLGVCYSWAANDSIVAFHSTGHFRSVNGTQKDSCSGGTGGSCWNYSKATFVDANNGSYGHCMVGSYPCEEGVQGGIAEKAATDARNNAN